jgi:hypothetical protein
MVSRQTIAGFRADAPEQSSDAANLLASLYGTRRRETLFYFNCAKAGGHRRIK